MGKQHMLRELESFYREHSKDGGDCDGFTFCDFVENEYEQRHSLAEGWSDDNPEEHKDSLSYYAGVILGEL